MDVSTLPSSLLTTILAVPHPNHPLHLCPSPTSGKAQLVLFFENFCGSSREKWSLSPLIKYITTLLLDSRKTSSIIPEISVVLANFHGTCLCYFRSHHGLIQVLFVLLIRGDHRCCGKPWPPCPLEHLRSPMSSAKLHLGSNPVCPFMSAISLADLKADLAGSCWRGQWKFLFLHMVVKSISQKPHSQFLSYLISHCLGPFLGP